MLGYIITAIILDVPVCTIVMVHHHGNHLSRNTTKPTKWHVHPAKTQISLGIRPVWSESSLCTQSFFMRTAKTLIKLGRCPGWSESLLSRHAVLLVLSWGGSFDLSPLQILACQKAVYSKTARLSDKSGKFSFCPAENFSLSDKCPLTLRKSQILVTDKVLWNLIIVGLKEPLFMAFGHYSQLVNKMLW